MSKTIGRIDRTGVVHFGDASLSVWEEGISNARAAGGFAGAEKWERTFKRQVFARMLQTLNRLGWVCTVPPVDTKQGSQWLARQFRDCAKGDLKGELHISGRSIEFNMWQGVNTPTRPDHGGKYEHNKEACMPYVLRLEMERTRRRIRDYLCNVFTEYTFDTKRRTIYAKPLQFTALQRIEQNYAESWHFKGDWPAYLEKTQGMPWNRKSADGVMLDHGQRVWFADRKGRICEGTALYNINNMWWVVTGRYSYTNEGSFHLYTKAPENLRIKRNAGLRRKRLERLMEDAVRAMQFERAVVLRNILFPKGEPLFMVYHEEARAYHRAGFSGYSNDTVGAGKFTQAELRGWNAPPNKIVPMAAPEVEACHA